MKIGIHGKEFDAGTAVVIQEIFDFLFAKKAEIYFSEAYCSIIKSSAVKVPSLRKFAQKNLPALGLKVVITLGGDGTLLDVVSQIGDLEIPILGINIGRLGFLATTSKENAINSLKLVFEGKYDYDMRALLRLETDKGFFGDKNFALNDFTILKKDTSSMIVVHTYVNGDFLNSYWADGLIISTPTGSTGYSLSCGGPLILPQSNNFVITPISPHNLTARPMVLSDDSEITLKIEGRSDSFLVSLDSRFEVIENRPLLKVVKESFNAKLIKLPDNQIFDTLRQKLNWGVDVRN